jgi:DNA-binding CsgD family transcriptional regulator
LNEQEIELCCLMRANIDTKDIATLIGQSVYSVQKRRTTIRKKLAMEEGADIIRFLETRLYNA